MLWMITDFSNFNSIAQADRHICSIANAGVDKFYLRNWESFFSVKAFENLYRNLKEKFKNALFFIPYSDEHEIPADQLHVKSCDQKLISLLKKGDSKIKISTSSHSMNEIVLNFNRGADYQFLSPMFTPFSKHNDNRKHIEPVNKKNVYLLGGITTKRASALIKRGFHNFAGISMFHENIDSIKFLINEINEAKNGTVDTN